MNDCIPVDQLETLKALPEDDPRRRHAATCPRCSSLLFAYDEFVRADSRAGADPVAAEMSLARFIAARVESGEPGRAAGSPSPDRGRWFDLRFLRIAATAVAVVFLAVVLVRWQPWQSKEIVYRGEASAHFAGLAAQAASDGSVEMRWNAVPGADGYRVTILTQNLEEITHFETGRALSAHLDPRTSGAPASYYWQVTALADGAEMLTSDPQRLP
jgi:hypothetical protein